MKKEIESQRAAFAMGCFWGPQELFNRQNGILATEVGYAGGHFENPTYEQVCSKKTGHAETTRIEFDPKIIKYEDLLKIFWENHDPTTPNRQGPDVGTQYRSVIFYYNENQKEKALKSKEERQKNLSDKITTEIEKMENFYPAEEYHQNYLKKRNMGPSCPPH